MVGSRIFFSVVVSLCQGASVIQDIVMHGFVLLTQIEYGDLYSPDV